jgi:hypothetical protein
MDVLALVYGRDHQHRHRGNANMVLSSIAGSRARITPADPRFRLFAAAGVFRA